MIRILRVTLVLLLCALLAGCMIRLAYSQADWLIARQVNQYVTLDDAQSSFFDSRINARLEWHCASEVPRYQAWFAALEEDARSPDLDRETLEARMDEAESFIRTLAERIAPDAAALLASLSDEQVEELLDNLAEQQSELREEFADPDAGTRRTERADRMESRLERFYGRLNEAQRTRVAEWADGLAARPEQWLASRERWHDAFRKALEIRDEDRDAFRAEMQTLLTDWEAFWEEDYQQAVERSREQAIDLLVDIHNLATERQRDRAARNLASWERDMGRMACS